MPTPFEPWQFYPSLNLEKLTFVAGIMRDARDGAVKLHDPAAGDSEWSLGCRIYSRIMSQVRNASLIKPWLTVLPETQALRFTFAVGNIPLKFYKGEPDDVPKKHLQPSYAELHQLDLAFKSEGIDSTSLLRIAVEPDFSGKTSTVTLVEVEESGSPVRVFQIPLDASTNVIELKPKPINLQPPALEVIEPISEEKESGGAEGQVGSAGGKS